METAPSGSTITIYTQTVKLGNKSISYSQAEAGLYKHKKE